ncbi:glycosyltransferase family 2 protein [Brachyspira pilosicoli]|uniref:glycosyltransferase family 2 protein n=1 Tax=Brachyspira pilosicoli TaxID=52584 RepID=UPI0012F50D16|nr:glycosyltransferase family 2 protein [Brachyspira pilosicoli]
MKKISFIIPCYNEEEVLPMLYDRLDKVSKQLVDYECEFLFINDGSKDKTEEIIDSFHNKDNRVKLYSFSRNFGQYEALNCGMYNAKGDLAITIDADLQDPPEVILDMVREYETTEVDIIYGHRISRNSESFLRKFSSKYFYKVINSISDVNFSSDNNSEFRLMNRKVIDSYNQFNEKPKYMRGILNWSGFKQVPFKYEQKTRAAGYTKYSYSKLIKLAFTTILSFSKKPTKIFLFLSSIFFILSLLLFIILIINNYIFNIKAYNIIYILSSIILFTSSLTFLSFYIVLEYILNIFEEIKNRPRYIINKKLE